MSANLFRPQHNPIRLRAKQLFQSAINDGNFRRREEETSLWSCRSAVRSHPKVVAASQPQRSARAASTAASGQPVPRRSMEVIRPRRVPIESICHRLADSPLPLEKFAVQRVHFEAPASRN